MFEEILFLVSYFISVRYKHATGLHCDMVLRNVHEIKCKDVFIICVLCVSFQENYCHKI